MAEATDNHAQSDSAGEQADKVAAPMDMLLTDSALGVGRRMVPNSSWFRLGKSLAAKPFEVGARVQEMATEMTRVVGGNSTVGPNKSDKRFSDPAWSGNPVLRRIMQSYLAWSDTVHGLLTDADLDERDRERVQFVVDNIVDGSSPTNVPILNPLTYKAIVDTGGLSILRGSRNLAADMLTKPRVPAMIRSDAFSVGESVATSTGQVVLQNEEFELIQYAPTTEQVREIPVVLVPPVINKFYVLDLSPGRSLVEYLLSQRFQVFVISWRNPQPRHSAWGYDTYGQSIVDAMDAAEEITGVESSQLFATCSGGMLASMAVAHLTATGQGDRVAGLSLGVTVLDNRRAGFVEAALDENTASAALRKSAQQGYLDGADLAEVFAWLRPNDLVWRYWVNNYLEGKDPAPFDVLYWNADTVRMTAALHKDMVTTGLHNSLAYPGRATMLGTAIDLSEISADTFVMAGIADHISPWSSCYRSARLFSRSDTTFVLSTSGHIAALVNPTSNRKASYRWGAPDADDSEQWLADHQTQDGSWWPRYAEWLDSRTGDVVTAPSQLGSTAHRPVLAAPGSYAQEK